MLVSWSLHLVSASPASFLCVAEKPRDAVLLFCIGHHKKENLQQTTEDDGFRPKYMLIRREKIAFVCDTNRYKLPYKI